MRGARLTASIPATTDTARDKPRLEALTGLRWWAAFWVFAYHLRALIDIPAPLLWPIEFGYLGVTFFFVLSGFVLTWSMSSSVSLSTFYTRRFARIWPSHMVALALAIPVFYALSPQLDHDWVKPFDPGVLALSVPLAQGWSRNPDILFSGNPAAWTLSCELFFYALHPFIARAMVRLHQRGALLVAAGSIVVAVAYRFACNQDPSAWWSAYMPWPISRLPEFVVGVAIAWALRSGWRPRVRLWPTVAVFLAGVAAISVVPRRMPENAAVSFAADFSNEFMTALCALVIVGVAVSSLAGRRTWLASGPMVRLGLWSYAFYLVHATVIYAVLNVRGGVTGTLPSIGWTVAALGGGLVVAYLLHRWVEFPAERGLRRWKDRRDAAQVPSVVR